MVSDYCLPAAAWHGIALNVQLESLLVDDIHVAPTCLTDPTWMHTLIVNHRDQRCESGTTTVTTMQLVFRHALYDWNESCRLVFVWREAAFCPQSGG